MRLLRVTAAFLLVPLVLVLGIGIGMRVEEKRLTANHGCQGASCMMGSGSGEVLQGDPEKSVDLTILWTTWRLLQQTYVSPDRLHTVPMVYGAVRGLVDAVGDPYTLFMDPEETKKFTESLAGTLEGIGAQLDLRDGAVTVVKPVRGSPAEKAGIMPHDIITAVDGQPVSGMRLDDVVMRIRGPVGTTVTLTIVREGNAAPLSVPITREEIHVPSVEATLLSTKAGRILHLTINQFGDDTVALASKELRSMPRDVRGIILDLRSNGGGYLEGAVDLVSMFVERGTVVTVERRGVPQETHSVHGSTLQGSLPLVVLVDGGTASASEITAGALRDHKRAVLIGTQTFGKGTVQELIDVPGGSALRVTIAKWLTPSGHDLGSVGITPDMLVTRTVEEFTAGKDPQRDAAISYLEQHMK